MENFQQYIPFIQEQAIFYGVGLIKALVIFLIGKWLAKLISKGIGKAFEKTLKDPILVKFSINFCYALIMTFVIISAISQLGVQIASLIAILGAAGLAIGLALKGSLANFAAGILTIILRPYNIGDVVQIADHIGIVEEVNMFTTTLRFADKRKVIIPNSHTTENSIINFSEAGIRRVEMLVGISYDADIQEAKSTILATIKESEFCLENPEPSIGVIDLADNSVNLTVRAWSKSSNHFAAKTDMLERIKYALDERKIGIPYPQREVHIYEHNKQS